MVGRRLHLYEGRGPGQYAEVELLCRGQLIGGHGEDVHASRPPEAQDLRVGRRVANAADRSGRGGSVGPVVVGAGVQRRADRGETERQGAGTAAEVLCRTRLVRVHGSTRRAPDHDAALVDVQLAGFGPAHQGRELACRWTDVVPDGPAGRGERATVSHGAAASEPDRVELPVVNSLNW